MFTIICVIFFFILQGCGNLQKQDDNVMTNDSLAIGLCRQIEGDGTPNERILAHYILARTYVVLHRNAVMPASCRASRRSLK